MKGGRVNGGNALRVECVHRCLRTYIFDKSSLVLGIREDPIYERWAYIGMNHLYNNKIVTEVFPMMSRMLQCLTLATSEASLKDNGRWLRVRASDTTTVVQIISK